MTQAPRRIGSHSLGEFPLDVVRIQCPRCDRAGSYRRDGLLARFGADIALPDLLVVLASCERRRDFTRPCGARFTDLAKQHSERGWAFSAATTINILYRARSSKNVPKWFAAGGTAGMSREVRPGRFDRSLEAFGRTVDRIAGLRVLLIVTFRPEFEAPWIGRPHVTALTINRLAQRDIGVMIDRVAGNKLIPTSVRQDIIERTDGIPLFVEEMTKAVLEAETEGEARRTVAAVPSPALVVPASLRASLMARLDRLGSAKEAAQIAAAIGREFSRRRGP